MPSENNRINIDSTEHIGRLLWRHRHLNPIESTNGIQALLQQYHRNNRRTPKSTHSRVPTTVQISTNQRGQREEQKDLQD